MRKLFVVFGLLGAVLFACTPKVTENTTQNPTPTTPNPPKVDENLSPCPKFSDAKDPDQVETDYVLYRDQMRINNIQKAYEGWQKVYSVAPAADGKRNTIYSDGIFFMEYFISQTTDSLKREPYIDRIFELYDELGKCYPANSYSTARKAFDLYYKYPHRSTPEQTYALFKQVIDKEGLKSPDFVINPFVALLTDLHTAGKISDAEAKVYDKKVREIIASGVALCKGEDCERWKIIDEYAPVRLQYFESVKGFYDCEYYATKYFPQFKAAPTDCEVIRDVYSRLKWGGCGETDTRLAEVVKAGNTNCKEDTEPTIVGAAGEAARCLRDGNYSCAIQNYEKAANEATDAVSKGKYLLTIARIYESYLRNFSKARQYAQAAANARGGWGDPYLLIGRLYASSGPLCGPGRGWDSQVVVWAAMDMWNKAKSVDASAATEANRMIGRYGQYMPSMEEIFQRGLQEGNSYRIGCWIQTSSTIRAAR